MENVTTNESCNNGDWTLNFSTIVPEKVVEVGILCTSVVLNIVLLTTICCSRLLQTSTHIVISSLAVSDILFSVYGLAQLTINVMASRRCFSIASRDHIDKGINIAYLVNTFSGYMNILFVSGERWLFISRPFLHERLVSRGLTCIGVSVAWVTSLLVNLDGFLVTLKNYTTIENIKSEVVIPCVHSVVAVALFVIHVHVTIITRRQMNAINSRRFLPATNDDTTRNARLMNTKMKQLKENLRSIRLLVTVFGGFVVLLSPGIYYHFYVRFSWEKKEHPHIHEGFKLLTYSHSLVNFIVFARLDRRFRRVLMAWLRKATCRNVICVSQVNDTTSVSRGCRSDCQVNVDGCSSTM